MADEGQRDHFVDAQTTEDVWRQWCANLPVCSLSPGRLIVVAPHPDDETLAVGGALAQKARELRGLDVHVISVTNGEKSHPGLPGLAKRRRAEMAEALTALGLASAQVSTLGLPDGGVAKHEDELTAAIRQAITGGFADASTTTVLAPWHLDAHPDHDACGRAASAAAGASGARLLMYPVWSWQWATPADFVGLHMCRLDVDAEAKASKERAIACYSSQTEAQAGRVILTNEMLAHFERDFEIFIQPS